MVEERGVEVVEERGGGVGGGEKEDSRGRMEVVEDWWRKEGWRWWRSNRG